MNSGRRLITGLIITLCVSITLGTSVFAAQNSVSSVNIKQNSNGEYQILLKTDKTAKIKKTTEENKLLLTVASATPSNSSEIVYDNVPGIQNVTVQKKNDENTLIIIQGDNIENSVVFNKDLSTGKTSAVDNKQSAFIIADKKLFACSMLTVLFLFILTLISRPKEKRYSENTIIRRAEATARNSALTLRQKAMLQNANVPSVNSKISGSFISSTVTKPGDFNTFIENEYVEKTRKAG